MKNEEEVRGVLGESGLHRYSPNALREIVFGTKTNSANIKQKKDIVSTPTWQHVKLKRVRHVAGSFDFEITQHGA